MNKEFRPTKLEEIFWIVTGIDIELIQERFMLKPLRRYEDGNFFIRAHDKLNLTTKDVKVSKSFFEENPQYLSLAIEVASRKETKKKKVNGGFSKSRRYIAASIIGLAGIAGLGFGSYKLCRNHQFDINVRVVQEAIDSKDYEHASNLLYEFAVGGKLREKDMMDLDSIIDIERKKLSFERVQKSAKKAAENSVKKEKERTQNLESKLGNVKDGKSSLSSITKTKDEIKTISEGTASIDKTFGDELILNAKDYHYSAAYYFNQGDYSEAIKELRQAIQLDPKFIAAYIDLGRALNAQKDFNGAREAYRKALQLEPSNVNVQNNLEETLNSYIQYLNERVGTRGLVLSKDLESILNQVDRHVILPKGRYEIDFDITVNPNGLLEIKSGAELYFGSEAGIISYGILDARGTEKEKILFTALKDEWKNITIVGKFANESVLKHCEVSKGSKGLELYESNATIEANSINNNNARLVGGGLDLYRSAALIKGNIIKDNVAYNKGGGLWIIESNAILEENNVFRNKAGSSYGGGLAIHNSKLTLYKNTVQDNECNEFGGGIAAYNSKVVLTQNVIENNRTETYSGGGLYLKESNGKLIDNTIRNNYAENSGGGICLDKSNPFIQNNNITKNRTNGEGGGIEFFSSSPILEKNIINENFAYNGGGLYFGENSDPNLRDNVITHNEAYNHGGGLYISQSDYFDRIGDEYYDVKLENNTISLNHARGSGTYPKYFTYGGGVYFNGRKMSLMIFKLIFSKNKITNNNPDNIYPEVSKNDK